MRRPTQTAATPAPLLLSTDALRRAALARAAERGHRIARRRVLRRWLTWGLGRVLLRVLLPLLVLATTGFILIWQAQAHGLSHPILSAIHRWLPPLLKQFLETP